MLRVLYYTKGKQMQRNLLTEKEKEIVRLRQIIYELKENNKALLNKVQKLKAYLRNA